MLAAVVHDPTLSHTAAVVTLPPSHLAAVQMVVLSG
jgi:hypothetical protein